MLGIFTKKKWVNLIIVSLTLVMALSGCGKKGNSATVSTRTGSAVKETSAEDLEDITVTVVDENLYIVEDLDMESEAISLYSISGDRQIRYNYTMATKFLDKYGDSSSWASFSPGTVVTIGEKFDASGAISEVRKSPIVWVYEDLSKYEIDAEKNVFTINGSNYKLAKAKAYSDNERINLSDIGKDDVLTVIGKDKDILSISVTTGHGYIQLKNTSLFNNSLIFIGNKIVSMVYGDCTIEVPEGTYDVTVANDGWGGTAPYTVTRNQITEISLEDLKGEGPSFCDLTFLVTVPDTYVYIDGKLIDTNEVNQVRYGAHKLVVQCSGYTSWNKTLVVNSESATITLAMEEEQETINPSDKEPEKEEEESKPQDNTPQGIADSINNNTTNSEEYDYEKDYLSTISDMLSSLMN